MESAQMSSTFDKSPEQLKAEFVNGFIPRMNGESLIVVISENLSDETLKLAYDAFLKCSCCNRHKSSRPCGIDSPFNTEKIAHVQHSTCKCACRYGARYLRRAYFFRHFPGQCPVDDDEMKDLYAE
jgi:hypothetical protein